VTGTGRAPLRCGSTPEGALAPAPLRPGLQHLLDAMTGAPAFVRNGRLDLTFEAMPIAGETNPTLTSAPTP
jgi:hypothetical protein